MSFQSDLQDLIDTIRTELPERLQETFEDAADRAARKGRHGRRKAARHMLRNSPLLRDEWNRQQQQEGTRTFFLFVVGLVGGAALMYLFDPDRGARRRALLRDQVTKVVNEAEDTLESKAKHVSNRVEGMMHEARGAAEAVGEALTDEALQAQVRAEVLRFASNPDAISVTVHNGIVTLGGRIRSSEAQPLLNRVREISGNGMVESRLELHEEAGSVPAKPKGANANGTSLP